MSHHLTIGRANQFSKHIDRKNSISTTDSDGLPTSPHFTESQKKTTQPDSRKTLLARLAKILSVSQYLF